MTPLFNEDFKQNQPYTIGSQLDKESLVILKEQNIIRRPVEHES